VGPKHGFDGGEIFKEFVHAVTNVSIVIELFSPYWPFKVETEARHGHVIALTCRCVNDVGGRELCVEMLLWSSWKYVLVN
jgi:hypothetical protein